MKLSVFFVLLIISCSGFAQDPQQTSTAASGAVTSPVSTAAPAAILPEELDGAGQVSPSSNNENPAIVLISTLNTEQASPTVTASPTTTAQPRTTTQEATTIQLSSSTTRQPTDSTTHTVPTSSTAPPPVPTPPRFPKNVGNWSVFEGQAIPCLSIVGALQIHLKPENIPEIVTDVPNTLTNVNVSGTCGESKQELVLNWWSTLNETGERQNTLQLTFAKDDNETYAITKILFAVHDIIPDETDNPLAYQISGRFFPTSISRSYQCLSNQRLEETENGNMFVLTESLQFEAFKENGSGNSTTAQFSEAEHCKADNRYSTGTVLWIAIGVGVLIVSLIALVVYCIKRSRRDGYVPLDAQTRT